MYIYILCILCVYIYIYIYPLFIGQKTVNTDSYTAHPLPHRISWPHRTFRSKALGIDPCLGGKHGINCGGLNSCSAVSLYHIIVFPYRIYNMYSIGIICILYVYSVYVYIYIYTHRLYIHILSWSIIYTCLCKYMLSTNKGDYHKWLSCKQHLLGPDTSRLHEASHGGVTPWDPKW